MFAASPFCVMAGLDPRLSGHDEARRGFADLPGVVYFAKSAP